MNDLMVHQISDRLVVFVSHGYVTISIFGREPFSIRIGPELDEVISMLKRKRLKRKLGL